MSSTSGVVVANSKAAAALTYQTNAIRPIMHLVLDLRALFMGTKVPWHLFCWRGTSGSAELSQRSG